jgi:toxin ParE1/3/4
MIYRIVGQRVYVYLIVDGWRDMQALLARRLLEA